MSVWVDIHKRSCGDLERMEDIHKASLLIKRIGNAEKLSGFYTRGKILFKLNHDQQQSFRWHRCDLVLDDDRFKRRALFRFGVLSPLGDTGESVVQEAIDKVEKEYGYFDGYTCDEEKADMHRYVSEKTKKMIDEVRDILDRHGMVLLGWRTLVSYRRAISAELIQDLYYDSDSPVGKASRVLRTYVTTNKEKEIGLYKVTFELFKKNQGEEKIIKTLTDDRFYAAIGTDVVATWQKVNDEHIRVNGNWNAFVPPRGAPFDETSIYCIENKDIQEEKYLKIRRAYHDTLCKEHGCKIGEFEDDKLSVKYWDAFTNYLNQKDMDTLKKDETYTYSYIFKEVFSGFYYSCRINPGHKDPTNSIVVAIRLNNDKQFDFIEEKLKTQIESLQCQEVRWKRGGVIDGKEYVTFIRIMLGANFRDKADWPRQMDWMYNTLVELHKIVKPYYSEIREIK